jgi:high-affinity nickel-transport protein
MANFDINRAGFMIAALFVVVWVVALVVWRMGKVEARWEESLVTSQPSEP